MLHKIQYKNKCKGYKSVRYQSSIGISSVLMSQKGPEVGQGMLEFVEDLRYDVVSH